MSLLLFTDLSGRNITEQTLKDTGILPLLSAVLNEKEKVAVEEYLRKSPTYREIQKRQEFFASYWEEEAVREFLKKAEAHFRHLSELRSFYRQRKDSVLFYFRYAWDYCQMIEELADTDDSFHSSLVSELLQNLRREASREAYRALSTEINHLTETADGYRKMEMHVRLEETDCTLNFVHPLQEGKSLSARLSGCLEILFDNSPEGKAAGLPLSDSDQYLDFLLRKFPCLKKGLEKFSSLCGTYAFLNTDACLQDLTAVHALSKMVAYLHQRGIPLTFPTVSPQAEFRITDGYDISLLTRQEPIIPNDFLMETPQSLLHGANSGGKTVFLRMVGICTILAMAGLPVPAGNMSVPYIGCIHSAFAQKEEIHRGRLQREKEALKHLIASAEPSDLILDNEIFSSTSEPEALELSGETLETFHRCRFYCLWNSHHPLHRLSDVPGMCRYAPSAVERYKIRKEECPLAGAQAIAASYGLSGEKLREKWRKRKILLQAKGRDGE